MCRINCIGLKLYLSFLLILCMTPSVMAQKKVIAQAQTLVKNGKDLARAEMMMSDLLNDSANRRNEKIWLTLQEAVRKQYEQGNEKLYLKQKYDTAALFSTARKLFLICEAFDSVEALPDKKGRVNIRHREKNAEWLHTLRPNLYNAGTFFLRKLDFDNSWNYYDSYIDCARQPLFAARNYMENDSLMPTAAYWALYSAYRLRQPERVMKYRELAETDTAHLDNILQCVAEMHLLESDTTAYIATLRRGFAHTPSHHFFFPRLIDYYNSRAMTDSANVFIDNALAADSTNSLFLFAKSSALLNAGQYKDCISITQKLLAINDSLPDAWCNMGLAYYNQAVELDRSMQRTRKKRKAVNALYEQSRPYMERFRSMAPTQQTKWVPALYTIYLNLNMGREFEEIDALREKLRQ